MYVTIKKSSDQVEMTNTIRSIDALFESDVFNTPVVEIPTVIEHKPFCRYKTFQTDEPNAHIHYEQLVTFREYVHRMLEQHPNPESEYIHFAIPKKTHGFRPIDAPKDELKKDQKKLSEMLTCFLDVCPHDAAWAYVRGRSVVGAMKEHTRNESKWYLKLDLHNFFGSINEDFAVSSLMQLYPFATAPEVCEPALKELFKLGSLNGVLPQGTPLSPNLTNLIMVQYDYKICKLLSTLGKTGEVRKQRYVYTRYADDIIISAKTDFDFNKIIQGIEKIFQDTPLQINREKTRYGNSSGRNWNLGVMCNKDNGLTTGYKHVISVRSKIHAYMKSLHEDNDWELPELQNLLGNISWLHQVNPDGCHKLLQQCNQKYERDVYNTLLNDIREKQQL